VGRAGLVCPLLKAALSVAPASSLRRNSATAAVESKKLRRGLLGKFDDAAAQRLQRKSAPSVVAAVGCFGVHSQFRAARLYASAAGSFWEETMLRFVAIGLCAATALTPLAAIAQTDQLSIPSATGASTPAQAVKQSAG
jgi:hypothetical protein